MDAFLYDLPYENTEWGIFYSNYKTKTQGQLQKFLLHMKKERANWIQEFKKGEYSKSQLCKHIFHQTGFNAEKKMNETPKLLLYNSKKVKNEEKCKKDEIYEKVLMEYLRRQLIEMQEVVCYFENQKRELAIIQKVKR